MVGGTAGVGSVDGLAVAVAAGPVAVTVGARWTVAAGVLVVVGVAVGCAASPPVPIRTAMMTSNARITAPTEMETTGRWRSISINASIGTTPFL
jgi:hypothetical protein